MWSAAYRSHHHARLVGITIGLSASFIPHYQQEPLPDAEAYHRWIIARRYQAVGFAASQC